MGNTSPEEDILLAEDYILEKAVDVEEKADMTGEIQIHKEWRDCITTIITVSVMGMTL